MLQAVDPLKRIVKLPRSILFGHIYRRHPELKGKVTEIEKTITEPDFIAKSKKDGRWRSNHMAKKNLYIGYDEGADELIITTNPKAKTAGYFIDSGTAVLLGLRDLRPYGFSFILLKEFFKKHKRSAFAKIPMEGTIHLPQPVQNKLHLLAEG